MRYALILVASITLTHVACAESPPTSTVSTGQVIENIHAWNGRVVTVEGWLGACQGYDCGIYPTLADARVVANGDYRSDEWRNAMDRRLSIGFAEEFDRAAAALQFQRVRLEAKVNDQCWPSNCSDRANILEPISIQAVTTPVETN